MSESQPVIKRTTTVLQRYPESNVYLQQMEDVPLGDSAPDPRRHTLTIDPEILEDLGTPDEVTVTIEPGDTMNSPMIPLMPGTLVIDFNTQRSWIPTFIEWVEEGGVLDFGGQQIPERLHDVLAGGTRLAKP